MRGFLFALPSSRHKNTPPFYGRGDVNSQLLSLKIIT